MSYPTASKVIVDGQVIQDLTEDTVTPETMLRGVTAHNAVGNAITGTFDADAYESALAIVVDGDEAPQNITAGQYLFIKNHSTLATGGYHATAAISSGDSITSSNVSADSDGVANSIKDKIGNVGNTDLQSQITSLGSKLTNIITEVISPIGNYFTRRDAFRIRVKGSILTVRSYINITTQIPANGEFASITTPSDGGTFLAVNTSSRALYIVSLLSTGKFVADAAIPVGYYYLIGCGIC